MRRTLIRIILALGNLHRRILARVYWLVGPRAAYWFSTLGARLIYWLLPPLQLRSEAICYAALNESHEIDEIRAIARQSFLNRTLNTTDLILARHRLDSRNYAAIGGTLPEPHLSDIRRKQQAGKPLILVTAYFGAFDLLPILLGYNDVTASVVYLPHSNAGFDRFRRAIRSKSGTELVSVADAGARLQDVLAVGGTIGVVADHHVEERAVPVELFGIETSVPRSIGLLAWRYNAEVVVAGIRRLDQPFRFAFEVQDIFEADTWQDEPDAVAYITQRYVAAIEQMIRKDPTQYLWAYARWGEEHAQAAMRAYVEKFPEYAAVAGLEKTTVTRRHGEE